MLSHRSLSVFFLAGFAASLSGQEVLREFRGTSAGDAFGIVAGAGDVDGDGTAELIIGAPLEDGLGVDAGAARVFSVRHGTVVHSFFGAHAGDRFGSAVAGGVDVNGDGYADLLVGADSDDTNGIDSGSVRVLSGRDGAELYTLFGPVNGDTQDEFGYSVARLGDVDGDAHDDFAVGAPRDDTGGPDFGSVFVFSGRTGDLLRTSSGVATGDLFGCSVRHAGDVDADGIPDLVVGSSKADGNGADCGSVFVFSGVDGSLLHRFDGDGADDRFGWCVDGAGDVDGDGHGDLICGAPFDDDQGLDFGKVMVFSGADGSVLHTFYGEGSSQWFGAAVSSIGDYDGDGRDDLLVGAGNNDDGGFHAGKVCVYSGSDGTLLGSMLGDEPGDQLGRFVGGLGDANGSEWPDMVAGAPQLDRSGGPGAGYARVYGLRGPVTYHGEDPGGLFGSRQGVAGAGDIDRDGFGDLIVGAPHASFNGRETGRVYVYSGRTSALLYVFDGPPERAQLGGAVDGAGDVDGDGYDDLVAGGHWQVFPVGGYHSGLARVFSGRDGSVLYTFYGTYDDRLGSSVCGLGDVNGDGHADVAVGAYNGMTPAGRAGTVQVFSGLDGAVLFRFEGARVGNRFGAEVRRAGDVNADGVSDLIVGASLTDHNGTDSGSAFVFSGTDGSLLYRFDGDRAGDEFGWGVNAAGDVDVDGFDDVICGAALNDDGGIDCGKVQVFSGRDGSVLHTFHGQDQLAYFGHAVAGIDDWNLDGWPDLVIGAHDAGHAGHKSGRVWIYSGRDGSLLRFIDGDAAQDRFGFSLASAGDVDGDARADLIVGAPQNHWNPPTRPYPGYARLFFASGVQPQLAPGRIAIFGHPCPDWLGYVPRIGFVGRPVLGESFDVTLRSAPPMAPAALNFDLARTQTNLGALGAPLCAVYAWPIFALRARISMIGTSEMPIAVPNRTVLIGTELFGQWAMLDLGANLLGAITSDACHLVVGN